MSISKVKPNDPIVGFAYVFSTEIESEARVGVNKTTVNLVSGKLWKTIYFTPGSAQLTSEQSLTTAGLLIGSKFQLNLTGCSDALLTEINGVCGRSVAIKLTFESGSVILCGGKNRKLRLRDTLSMGQKNSHVLSFDYKSSKNFTWLNLN